MLERLFNGHLEEDEPLYLVVHRHWIFGWRHLLKPFMALIATSLLLYAAPIKAIIYLVLGLDVFILIWMLRNFFDYFLDAWIITDRAIIDVEWHGWFHRESTRIDYSSIEGVSYEIKGVVGTCLRYGIVSIEKIGSGSIVSLENVKKPRDIESVILACQDAHMHTRNIKDTDAIKDILTELIADRAYMQEQEEDEEEEDGDDDTS